MTCRGRPAILWLQGGMHRVCSFMLLARLQDICRDLQNCTYSLVTRTACGMLLSLCLHAERFFYFVYWRSFEITVYYAVSVCKYAQSTTGGLPILLFVCGLCPVSAEEEFEKDAIVLEQSWKLP